MAKDQNSALDKQPKKQLTSEDIKAIKDAKNKAIYSTEPVKK